MITINLAKITGYTGASLAKLNSALALIPPVLNSSDFKKAVMNYKTNGVLTFSYKKNLFKYFETYTNAEVYDLIMQAQENPGNETNGVIDLYLDLLPGGGGSTIGYGNPGDETIHTFSDWFTNASEKEIANHIVHEWCHKIGFDHAKYPWQDKNRERSVPYGIGDLVEELCGLPGLN